MDSMEENRVYEFVPVEDVKPQGTFVKAICFKPKRATIICLIIGIAFMFWNNMFARFLGIFFIAMSAAVLKMVNDHKVIDIFDKGVMVYGDDENRTACFISYDEIVEWNVSHENGHDTIYFDLGDNIKIYKDSFEADTAFRTLNQYMKEKESGYIRAQKAREIPFSINRAINNIRKRFFK